MCDNHHPQSFQPDCQSVGLSGTRLSTDALLQLALTDRQAALQLFMKDVPPAYAEPSNQALLEQAFDGYIALLQEQQAQTQEVSHAH